VNATNVSIAIIIDNQNRIAITKRHSNDSQGGLWEFPGGKVEAEETDFQALQRELLEEIGVLVKEAVLFSSVSHQYSDVNVTLNCYHVQEYEGVPRSLENKIFKWVPLSLLQTYSFPEANRSILNKVMTELKR
jgi:8-oxo-dGTP diphosphatase